MNALLYLASFFLLTSMGVFGFDLPGAFLIDRNTSAGEANSGYFISVPEALPARTAPDSTIESVDPRSHTMKEPALAPTPRLTTNQPSDVAPSSTSATPLLEEPTRNVAAGPTVAIAAIEHSFTTSAIVNATNNERIRRGLRPLDIDPGLTTMAEKKVDDMVRYDYFEHVSPAGVGLNDLAQSVDYQYILIGENLAYGNFTDPQSIVDAWMDSPGHRANILHEKYTHIGVSIRQAHFRGIDAWIAVQEFSIPAATCPPPSEVMSARIIARRGELDAYQQELTKRDDELSKTPTSSSRYNTLVSEYNALVAEFRALADIHNAQVAQYNEAVRAHQACVASVS